MEKTPRPERRTTGAATRVMSILLAVVLVLAILCVAAPTARKKEQLDSVGDAMLTQLELIPDMLSYYSGDYIADLVQNPADTAAYGCVSAPLRVLCTTGGYDSALLIMQSDRQYICVADGMLGTGGNTYGAGTLLSLDKPVTRLLDEVFSGGEGGTVSDLVAARAGGDAVCVILPVYGADGSAAAALAVQYAVGETQHHMLLGINLYAAFGILMGIAVILVLLLILGKHIRDRRAAKNTPPDPEPSGPAPTHAPAPDPAPAHEPTHAPAHTPAHDFTLPDEPISPSLTLPGETDTPDGENKE